MTIFNLLILFIIMFKVLCSSDISFAVVYLYIFKTHSQLSIIIYTMQSNYNAILSQHSQ